MGKIKIKNKNENWKNTQALSSPDTTYDYNQVNMSMGNFSSDEYQQSHSTEDQENQDNSQSASGEHNRMGRDKRSVEGDEWKLFPPTNTTGAWLFGK